MICPAHNSSPMRTSIIDAYIENYERIMSGIEGDSDISSPTCGFPGDHKIKEERRPEYRRSEWKDTTIIYNINRVFNNQQYK